MKIAFFLDQSFPPDSRVENEAFSLIEAGHEVDLFSLNFGNLSPELEVVNGIRVHRAPVSSSVYKISALAYTFPFFHYLIKPLIKTFILKVQPEALHVHDMLIAKAVVDVNDENFQLPLTLDLHENRPEILQFYPHLQKFPGKQLINIDSWRKAQNALIERADYVVMVTPEAIEDAVKDTGRESSDFIAVPNTIEPDIYYNYAFDEGILDKLKGCFNIVYVGDTGLRRGTDTAIFALNLLRKEIANVRLVLVGRSTQDETLKGLVEEMNLAEHVLFEGWQDVSLFPSYIEASNVCISPLHRNKHHDTTLANKLFQYMAGGKPLVVSDCPSQINVIEDAECGYVFEAENADELAKKILSIYKNPELANKMGAAGKSAVNDKFNWKNTSKALIAHYTRIQSSLKAK